MAQIVPVHDSSKALAYIRSQMECGGSLFRRTQGVLDSGALYIIIPDAVSDQLKDHPFERGLGLKSGTARAKSVGDANALTLVQGPTPTEAALASLESLSSTADWLVVADAHHLAPTDPVVQRSPLSVRTFESDVYFICETTKGRDHIRSLILRGSSAWYGAAMLVGPHVPESSADGERWGEGDVAALASNMRALLVCAYDQEGYVLWVSRECNASKIFSDERRVSGSRSG